MSFTLPKIDLRQLPLEALEAMLEAYSDLAEERKEDAYQQLLEKAILIEAKKRRGKTLSAVGLSWELRERFGRPVVCVGSNMGLTDAFGPYQFMSEAVFKEELERINIATQVEENAEAVMKAFKKYGITILYATVIFDEARKLVSSRKTQDKMVQLVGDYLMQSAHYHTTNLFTAPGADELDKRIIRQLDWKGRVYHNKYTNTARVRLVSGIDVLTFDVNGVDERYHAPFYSMYNSWALLGFKKNSLKIKGL